MKKNGSKLIISILCASALLASGCAKQESAAQAAGTGAPGQQGQAGRTGAGGQYGGQGGQGARRSTVIPVQTMLVSVGPLIAERSSSGVVSPVIQSNVAASVSGIVLRVPRKVGDWVNAGAVIAQLDDSQLKLGLATAQAALENARINLSIGSDSSAQAGPKLQLQLQSAQSALDSAQKNYDSQKALFDMGGISASAMDTATSQLATARANLEAAKTALEQNSKSGDQSLAQLKLSVTQAQNQVDQATLNLQNASIRAPFAGQIAAINVQPGMYVGLNTVAFTLVSSDRHIAFNVAPGDAPLLRAGAAVTFSVGGREYPARIAQDPSIPISGSVPMIAVQAGSPLPFGTVGDLAYRIPLATGALLPMSALQTLENKNYVFIEVGGRAQTADVTILAESGTEAAVSGIKAGDIVIISPPPGLIQGAQVQSITMSPAPGQASPGSASGRAAGQWSGRPQGSPGASSRQGGSPGSGGQWAGRQRGGAAASPAPQAGN